LRPKLVVGTVVALVVIGAVAYGAVRFFAPATDHAIELVPRDAVAYTSLFLKPSTSQRQALKTILEAFPASDSSGEAEALFESLLDEVLNGSDLDLDYKTDVEPWLGEEVAAFALAPTGPGAEPDAAVALATTDADRTMAAIDRAVAGPSNAHTYREVEYRSNNAWVAGVVEDFLVVGTQGAFENAVDTVLDEGATLADHAAYRDAVDALREDRLALFYLDTPKLMNSFPDGSGVAPSLLNGSVATFRAPLAAALYARDGEIVIDDVVALPAEPFSETVRAAVEDEGLLPHVTGRAWAGVGVPNLGETITAGLEGFGGPMGMVGILEQQFLSPLGLDLQEDILGWMGDAALYAQEIDPAETLSYGAVIQSTDPARSTAVVNRLHGLLLARFKAPVGQISVQGYSGAEVPRSFLEGRSGFSLQERGSLHPLNVVADGDRVYIVLGRFATFDALNGGSELRDRLSFPAASQSLGEGYRVGLFLSVPSLVQVFNELPTLSDGKWESEIRPNLLSISHVVFGSKIQDDRLFQRLVVRVH
jgi:hypothetical protein